MRRVHLGMRQPSSWDGWCLLRRHSDIAEQLNPYCKQVVRTARGVDTAGVRHKHIERVAAALKEDILSTQGLERETSSWAGVLVMGWSLSVVTRDAIEAAQPACWQAECLQSARLIPK